MVKKAQKRPHNNHPAKYIHQHCSSGGVRQEFVLEKNAPRGQALKVGDNKCYFPYILTPPCSLMNTVLYGMSRGSHKFLLCAPICTVAGVQWQMSFSICSSQFWCWKFSRPWSFCKINDFTLKSFPLSESMNYSSSISLVSIHQSLLYTHTTAADLHFNILTATLVTRFGFSLSRPSASPITT